MRDEQGATGPPSLTVKQVASLEQVKPKTVRKLLRSGELPGYKMGRDWRVTVEAFVAHRSRRPAAPISAEDRLLESHGKD